MIESVVPKGEMTDPYRELWNRSDIVADNNGFFSVETDDMLEVKADIMYSLTDNQIISFDVVDIDDGNCVKNSMSCHGLTLTLAIKSVLSQAEWGATAIVHIALMNN